MSIVSPDSDETVASLLTAGDVLWPLTDHLGSVRDLAHFDPLTDTTTVVAHRIYDAFGNVRGGTGTAECLFGFTGRMFDTATQLQNNLHRWYDAKVGRWLSEDPIGFAAGDANLSRYVGNGPTTKTDPSGLACDLSQFTDAQLTTALAKARVGQKIAICCATTGKTLKECKGKQAGNPVTGAKDPVFNAFEKCWGEAWWGFTSHLAFQCVSRPLYNCYADKPGNFYNFWGAVEAQRHQRLIDMITAELATRRLPK